MTKPNRIERLKAQLAPYDFFPQIDQVDLRNLSEDQRFYLKNFGIYNHKLAPETFMLRLRITAGRISTSKLHLIGKLAEVYQLRLILTMRAQIELHDLNADNVLEVWKRLESSGLTTWQTLSDNLRNIVTDPLDGEIEANQIEVYPLIREMEALFLKNPDYLGTLPRKFNTAICGSTQSGHSFFSNDLYFALAQRKGRIGFNLYLGGKNSEMAQKSDIFVAKEGVLPLFEAVIKCYILYGLRNSRSKTRLFHTLQHLGMETFSAYLRQHCPYKLESAGELLTKKSSSKDFTQLRNGKYAWRRQTFFGQIDTKELLQLCRFAKEKTLSIRLGIDQNIYLVGLDNLITPFANQSFPDKISVCAGRRYCSLSLFDMKEEALHLPLGRLKSLDVSVGFSGCLKGCGKHQHTDIGLVGLRTAIYGPTQKSLRLFLGSEYSDGKTTARLVLMAVPLHAIGEVIGLILDEFEASGCKDFENFSSTLLNRFSTDFLALWFLAKYFYQNKIPLKVTHNDPDTLHSIEEEKNIIKSAFCDTELWSDEGVPFHKGIQKISQKLWGEYYPTS